MMQQIRWLWENMDPPFRRRHIAALCISVFTCFLLLVNPMSALWFGIFILVLQQIDGNIIGPLILGDHVGLSAFWIMLAITIGGGLFGFAGMLLSVPTFALIYAISRTIIDKRLQARGLPAETDHYIVTREAPTHKKKAKKEKQA